MTAKPIYTLLTFYKFVDIANPEEQVLQHKQLCADIGMKWRIYISEEGISATVTCNPGQLQAYKLYLASNPYFQNIPDIDIKASKLTSHAFAKMTVKYRPEIVALGMKVKQKEVDQSYQKINIDEFKHIVESNDPNYEILDMRNSYEYKLGHFKKAVPSGTVNFREVQNLAKKYMEDFANKKVIMYCTGGIRCEKLSVLLKKQGLTNFYALDGGVVKYINTFNDGNRLGNLYTFDGLVSTRVGDTKTHTTIGQCIYSGHKTNFIENCRYSPCNARIIASKKQYKRHLGFCSQECFNKAKQDLLIKTDISVEPTDYITLRSQIKKGELNFETTREHIANFLDSKIGKATFNHATSQKEEYIDCQC